MSTAESICNLALAKLGLSNRVASLAAPTLPIERHFYTIYSHYRDVELRRYRWLFARGEWTLTQVTGTLRLDTNRPYAYVIPDELLNPWRNKDSEWQRVGGELRSGYPGTLYVEGVKRQSEGQFDVLFTEVLAARLALESLDLPGIAEAKRQDAKDWYKQAVADARQQNAFLRGADDIQDDSAFSWLAARSH